MRKSRTSCGSQHKSQLRLPRRSVRKSRAMPPLEVRGRRNSVNSIPTRPAAQFQTPRTAPREIPPNAVHIQIRAQWPRELPRKAANATGSGLWYSSVGQYFFGRHAPGPLKILAQSRVQTPRAVATGVHAQGRASSDAARRGQSSSAEGWGGAAEGSAAYGGHLP